MTSSILTIRELNLDTDLENGFRDSLGALSPTDAPDHSIRLSYIFSRDSVTHKTYVAVSNGRIIGTASLLIEHKLSRNCKPVGHVEDVAVHPDFHGRGIGFALVEFVVEKCKEFECRRVILDCDPTLVEFYEKAGFVRNGVAMRMEL